MKQVDKEHYKFENYISCPRFISFWHQINETMRFHPKRVLEVGPGSGIVTDIIKKQGVAVTTLDYADDVGADVVGSVLELPFKENEFDVIVCCQVLEHLPYESFDRALSEIQRVAQKGAVISLPHAGKYIVYSGYIPIFRRVKFGITIPASNIEHVFDGQHYWEIGKKNYPLGRIKSAMQNHFARVRDYRLVDNDYHHFFVCEKGDVGAGATQILSALPETNPAV